MQAQVDRGQIRPVNVPVAARAVLSTFVGLLILRILGDEMVLYAWHELPDMWRGQGLSQNAVADAIRLSEEKYWSVSTTLAKAVEFTTEYRIVEEE